MNNNIIKKEFLNHTLQEKNFHDVDPDFTFDKKYKTIQLKMNGKWKHTKQFKYTKQFILQKFQDDKILQVFFNVLNGPKFIAPHINENKYDTSLRYNYCVIVHNKEDGFLRVKNKNIYWKENKEFIFDTKQLHSVKKKSNYKRVLLIVDYIPQ